MAALSTRLEGICAAGALRKRTAVQRKSGRSVAQRVTDRAPSRLAKKRGRDRAPKRPSSSMRPAQ